MSQQQVVYVVASEECFGEGIIGVFTSLVKARAFADEKGEELNKTCVIYATNLDGQQHARVTFI